MALVKYDKSLESLRIHVAIPTPEELASLNKSLAETYLYKFARQADIVRPLGETSGEKQVKIPLGEMFVGEYQYVNTCMGTNGSRYGLDRRGIFCRLDNGKFDITKDETGHLKSGIFLTTSYLYADPNRCGLELLIRPPEEVNMHIRISGEEPSHNADNETIKVLPDNNAVRFDTVNLEKWKELVSRYNNTINTSDDTDSSIYGADVTPFVVYKSTNGTWLKNHEWAPKQKYGCFGLMKKTVSGEDINWTLIYAVTDSDNRTCITLGDQSASIARDKNTNINRDFVYKSDAISNDNIPAWSTSDEENWHYVLLHSNDVFTGEYADLNDKILFKVKFTWNTALSTDTIPQNLQDLYKKIGFPNNGVLDGGSTILDHYPADDPDGNPVPFSSYVYNAPSSLEVSKTRKSPLVSCWSDSIYLILVENLTKTALTAKAVKEYVDDCFAKFAGYVQNLCTDLISFVVSSNTDVFSGTNITFRSNDALSISTNANINQIIDSGITRVVKYDEMLTGDFPPIDDYTGYLMVMNINSNENFRKATKDGDVINEYDKIRIRQVLYPDTAKFGIWTRTGWADIALDINKDPLFGYLLDGEKVVDEDNVPIVDTLDANGVRQPPNLTEGVDYNGTYALFAGQYAPNPLYQDNTVDYLDRKDTGVTITWSDWTSIGGDLLSADNIRHQVDNQANIFMVDVDIDEYTLDSGVYRVRKSDATNNFLTGEFPPIDDWTGFLVIHDISNTSKDELPGDHIRQILYPDDINNTAPWTRVYVKSENRWSEWSMMGGGLRRVVMTSNVNPAQSNVMYESFGNYTLTLPDPSNVPVGTKIGLEQYSGIGKVSCGEFEQVTSSTDTDPTQSHGIVYIFECCISENQIDREWVMDYNYDDSNAIQESLEYAHKAYARKTQYHSQYATPTGNYPNIFENIFDMQVYDSASDVDYPFDPDNLYSVKLYNHVISIKNSDIVGRFDYPLSSENLANSQLNLNQQKAAALPNPNEVFVGCKIAFEIANDTTKDLSIYINARTNSEDVFVYEQFKLPGQSISYFEFEAFKDNSGNTNWILLTA